MGSRNVPRGCRCCAARERVRVRGLLQVASNLGPKHRIHGCRGGDSRGGGGGGVGRPLHQHVERHASCCGARRRVVAAGVAPAGDEPPPVSPAHRHAGKNGGNGSKAPQAAASIVGRLRHGTAPLHVVARESSGDGKIAQNMLVGEADSSDLVGPAGLSGMSVSAWAARLRR